MSANVEDYANRIAEGLRHDQYPSALTSADAQLIASRYGVSVPAQQTTIKALSALIADRMLNAPRQ